MKALQIVIDTLREQEAALREESRKAAAPLAYQIFGKAEGIKYAAEAFEAAINRLYAEDDNLKNLETEDIETNAAGEITAAEITRILLKYGVFLRGDYDFHRTREFRLTNGAKLVF